MHIYQKLNTYSIELKIAKHLRDKCSSLKKNVFLIVYQ